MQLRGNDLRDFRDPIGFTPIYVRFDGPVLAYFQIKSYGRSMAVVADILRVSRASVKNVTVH
jgi:hypothetical protein